MSKIYLDNSFLNRPFDNPDIAQNRIEAEILFWLISLIDRKQLMLVNSAILEYENANNPSRERRVFVMEILKSAKIFQNVTVEILRRAEQIHQQMHIDKIDALHLASAQVVQVDFFITCDYNLVKRYKEKLKVIEPQTFLREYE